jgi:hypothetical protein
VIRCAADVDHVPISRRSRVVVWDLSASPDDDYGAATQRLNDLIQRSRRWGIAVDIVTQLPIDWFGSEPERRVHGLVDSLAVWSTKPGGLGHACLSVASHRGGKGNIEAATSGVRLLPPITRYDAPGWTCSKS